MADEISKRQQLSICSDSGRKELSKLVDLVHVKLGDKAFAELAETSMVGLQDFFWKYLQYEWNHKTDPVGQFVKLQGLLEELPNHPEIRKFMS